MACWENVDLFRPLIDGLVTVLPNGKRGFRFRTPEHKKVTQRGQRRTELGFDRLVTLSPMDTPVTVAAEIPQVGDERGKNWAKIVTNVDDSLATGWAFDGEFIATGGIQDVPAGAVLLVYGEKGSRANPAIEAIVYTVNSDSTLSPRATARGRAWARTLRDPIEDLLAEQQAAPIHQLDWQPELMRYSGDALREELSRRDQD